MNGKEFTQHDMDIGKKLSIISTTLDGVLGTQQDIISRFDSFLETSDEEHKEMNEKITNNKVKIHRIIGIGAGVISVASIFIYLMRIL